MGGIPKGKRLQRIQNSPNFSNGIFTNPTPTDLKMPPLIFTKLMWQWLITNSGRKPRQPLPNLPLDLEKIKNHNGSKALICWLGHSSLLMKFHGKTFLIDPVFGDRVSMFSFFGPKRFKYNHDYCPTQLPEIDAVIFTHDHYDHLDYSLIPFLRKKVTQFIAPLGVGAHLEKWGVSSEMIVEKDWGETFQFDENITFTCEPTRHFAGRGFVKRFTSLWCSWVVKGTDQQLYLGADSGYYEGFKAIGEKHGAFDLTILECGAYSEFWSAIHMMPEETAQAHLDLNGKALLPIHWAKYDLSIHHWKEPIVRLAKKTREKDIQLLTPQIGETFIVNEEYPASSWWENVE